MTKVGTLLRGGHVAASGWQSPRRADVLVGAHGRIVAVGEGLPAAGADTVDASGRLIVPGLVDMHQHLDKSHTLDAAPNLSGTLAGASEAFAAYGRIATKEDIARRARKTVDACLARGTVAIRSHANVDYELRMRSVETLVALREDSRERMHLDIVAFVTGSAARGDLGEARRLLEGALAAGADTVGGAPNLAPDPAAFIDMLLDVAEKHDKRVDLHVDEHLRPQAENLLYLAQQTRLRGLGDRVVAGHCCSLSAMEDAAAGPVMDEVVRSGMGIVTLPTANLFLQGRGEARPTARGLTRVAELTGRGVPLASASDNIQDAFVPIGSGDMLELARWTILAGHLLRNEPALAFDMITRVPARLLGLEVQDIAPGEWANFLVTEMGDVTDLVRTGPLQRTVFYRGRVVAGAPLQQLKMA